MTTYIVTQIIFGILALIIGYKLGKTIFSKLKKLENNQNSIKVDLYTYKTDNGLPNGAVISDKDGKYIPVLMKRGYELKVPIHINFEDPHIRPPFIEHNNMLWLLHTFVQLEDRLNMIVMYAGSPEADKSPICADSAQMEETDLPNPEENLSIV